MFPAGGRQPFRLSPRRTPLFSSSPSRTRFGWFFLLIITPAFSRLEIGFTRGLHARLPAARADFYQRVRRLLTGGSLSSAVAQGLWRDKPAFARLVTAKCNEAGSAATASQHLSKTISFATVPFFVGERRRLAGNLLASRRIPAQSRTQVHSFAVTLTYRRPCRTMHPPGGSTPERQSPGLRPAGERQFCSA